MARGDWNEVGREREKVPPPIPADKRRLGQEERRLAIRPGQGFLMLRREKRAQLAKNIIAESERVMSSVSTHPSTPRASLAARPEKREYLR